MQLQGMDGKERRTRARAILKEVGLEGLENRRPAKLSGGQQQRVAVARAIVSGPSLVLADEPTANLDSYNGEMLLELMRKMNEEHGVTFILATHEQLVMDHARRLIHLHDGRIVSDEPPR
jgi:putative ABC transport system ATP-binding protein